MDKAYIEREYKLAVSDYKLATDDEDRHKALRAMHKLTMLATLAHGFEYADSLKAL